MGQLDASDWQAQWVALRPEAKAERPAAHYRRSFHLDRVPRHALLYATARGIYTCAANGHPVSDALFRPGWTNYHVRIPYQCYDVTALLRPGENVTVAGAYTFDVR